MHYWNIFVEYFELLVNFCEFELVVFAFSDSCCFLPAQYAGLALLGGVQGADDDEAEPAFERVGRDQEGIRKMRIGAAPREHDAAPAGPPPPRPDQARPTSRPSALSTAPPMPARCRPPALALLLRGAVTPAASTYLPLHSNSGDRACLSAYVLPYDISNALAR